jgi:hypothetical protein
MRHGTIPALGVLLALGTGLTLAAAEPSNDHAADPKAARYLRLVRDANDVPTSLDVAIVRYVPRDCGQTAPTVDLVGAVHIADAAYYKKLNHEFEQYDAVLYELVAAPGKRPPEGGVRSPTNPLSAIQMGLKDLLDLEFQLSAVHYNRPNMVHADMSPEQFSRSMENRGESFLGMFLRMFAYALAKQSPGGGNLDGMQLLLALCDRDRALALKRIMAEQFQDIEGSVQALGGAQGSTLIQERNKVALSVLRKQLAAGKQRIAIFYGAGHLGDFDQRLREDFDLTPITTRWLVAWDMKGGPKGGRATANAERKNHEAAASQ